MSTKNIAEIYASIVKRPEIEHYMSSSESGPWQRMGEGWIKFDDSSTAQTESVKYINQNTQTEDTTSYKVAYSFECDLMYADPTIKDVYRLYKDRKILDECDRYVLTVEKFDGNKESGFNAYLEKLSIAPSGISESSNRMRISGNFNGKGDPVKGKFVPDENGGGTFTAASDTSTETTT